MPNNNNIVAFFCGTGLEASEHSDIPDDAYLALKQHFPEDSGTELFGIDGCHVSAPITRGIFGFGVEEQADEFIKHLNIKLNQTTSNEIRVNLIGHSRGALAALLAVKKIQADPRLNKKVKITLDLRDPVPGNLPITTALPDALVLANQVKDLSDCTIVDKAYLTFFEEGFSPKAYFDVLIPNFAANTRVEIEALPGDHAVQEQREHLKIYKKNFPANILNFLEENKDKANNIIVKHEIEKLLSSHKEACDKDLIKFSWDIIEFLKTNSNFPEFTAWYHENSSKKHYAHLLFKLGIEKSLGILLKDKALNSVQNNPQGSEDDLEQTNTNNQVALYRQISEHSLFKTQMLSTKYNRGIHFGGKWSVNANDEDINCINTRHARLAKLKNIKPRYTISHPYSNFHRDCYDVVGEYNMEILRLWNLSQNESDKKILLELYIDDNSFNSLLNNSKKRNEIRKNLIENLSSTASSPNLDKKTLRALQTAIAKLGTLVYLNTLDEACESDATQSEFNNKLQADADNKTQHETNTNTETHSTPTSPQSSALVNLKKALHADIEYQIQQGKTYAEISQSKAVNIANETPVLLKDLNGKTPDEKIKLIEKFHTQHHLLSPKPTIQKRFVQALNLLASVLIGTIIGAVTGFVIGCAIGSVSGPGAILTGLTGAFLGGIKGAKAGVLYQGMLMGVLVGHKRANTIANNYAPSEAVQASLLQLK
ncbi:MAG: hypothetical protein KIT27_05160 [Legionellales bacterium]|nr:hypothetical protein [Legionellales bacterium]